MTRHLKFQYDNHGSRHTYNDIPGLFDVKIKVESTDEATGMKGIAKTLRTLADNIEASGFYYTRWD